MSLMKAPKLERRHVLALKTLIRLDFARAVKFKMESLQKAPGEHPAESTIKIMTLTDMLGDADQPLSVTLALMDMHGAASAWMPLSPERFDFYSKTLAVEVGPDDFKTIPADQLAKALEPLQALQAELRKIFAEADVVDPKELYKQAGKGSPVATQAGPSLLN